MNDSDKHSSLLLYDIITVVKSFRVQAAGSGACTIKLFSAVIVAVT